MPLPEKEYYSLQETAARWQTSLTNLHYYATHDLLELMVWVDHRIVNNCRPKQIDDGAVMAASVDVAIHEGYAVILPCDVRQVLRGGTQKIRKFLSATTHDLLVIHDSQPSYEISADDLVISLTERNRFEQSYVTEPGCASSAGNKRRSIVPMHDQVYEALLEARALSQTDFVIEFMNKPIKSLKKAFRDLCKACGIKASPHALRHTAATWMVMAGVPLSEAARMLGDSERTVEKVYGKHAPDYLRRAVSALKFKSSLNL